MLIIISIILIVLIFLIIIEILVKQCMPSICWLRLEKVVNPMNDFQLSCSGNWKFSHLSEICESEPLKWRNKCAKAKYDLTIKFDKKN